jgi:predicted transcriptional regulator/N-acetylglutamate synthase-like GNAT family acetyltransferase
MFEELNLTRDLKIVRLVKEIESKKYSYNNLKKLIEECEDLYPGIDIWFNKKVKTGLRHGERTALVVYHTNKPIAAAVLKKGEDAKLCSMRILPDEQNKGLGSLMLTLIAAEIRNHTYRIHFTIPKQLWIEKHSFFEEYGFINHGPATVQYRLFDEELICSANFKNLWSTVIKKIPLITEKFTLNGSSSHYDLVISIKPNFAKKITSGFKRIEVRRKFSLKWKGANAILYASHPQRQFFGEAKIKDIIINDPKIIWENWKDEMGCTLEEYINYCHGASTVSALVLGDIRTFRTPIFLSQMQHLVQQDLNPPQSHCGTRRDTIWPIALSISCLLRGEPLGSTKYL